MSLLRRAVAPARLEQRGAPGYLEWGSTVPPSNGMLGGSFAGVNVTEKTALQVAAVFGSVGVLCDSVATLPVRLLSSLDPAVRRELPSTPLLERPYVEISRLDWMVQFVYSLALRGNFFGDILERDENLYPSQIKPIHPDKVGVRRLPSGRVEYRFFGRPVPAERVFHVRYMSVPGNLVGLNPIEYLRSTLGLARAEDLYGASWFANSAMPSGTIEVMEDLDEEESERLARKWIGVHQGIGQANLPAVLTGGAKFNPVSITPADSQFLESRAFSQTQIASMIFRVPPHMIGLTEKSTSFGRGIEQQERNFVANTLTGYLGRYEEAMTLCHPPGQYVRFDLSQRLRGAKLELAQAHSLGILGGWLCADDIRAEEDRPPVPGGIGKTFLAPINTEPLKAMLAAIANGEGSSKEQAPEQESPPSAAVAQNGGTKRQ